MTQPIRILIVEDSEADAELLLRELKRGGYEPQSERVETHTELDAALNQQPWDLIVSDNAMPHFNGLQALKLTQEKGLDIPFILVSGSIGEDVAVAAMKAGAHDYLMKGNTARLLPAIARELREARIRQERRQADETIHRLAYTDPVTGLPNRVRFCELLDKTVAEQRDENRPVFLLLLNLDRFREVNDALGYDRGDSLLRKVGIRLRSTLFASDVIARLGGNEFGILMSRPDSTDDVSEVIKNIQQFLEEPFILDDIPIIVEASIGVVNVPEHGDNAATLLQRADIAMYRAKKMASGFAVYAPEYDQRSPERLGLMGELRDAIEGGQLLLHYQPKVDIKTGYIIGVEALVRWQHPRLGLLPPDTFILAAEQTGLIGPLTRWVLINALTHCQRMQLHVSVNLSARSLHDPHLVAFVSDALLKTGAMPQQLTLEVTESAIVLDPKSAEEMLAALNQMGIKISIDDFGTGYTSLASIKHLSVNEIKIDKSFVLGMLENNSDAAIVRSVIDLGHNLGLRIVAEGIETKEILEALADLGCDEAQGYYISKPQPGALLDDWFRTCAWKMELPHEK